MKFIWEEKDIYCGRRVGLGNGATETWIIGYDPSRHGKKTPALNLVSLSDGMLAQSGCDHAGLTKYLNDGNYCPLSLASSDFIGIL